MCHAHTVGPVGCNAETSHIRHDQQWWVFQRQRILSQLAERLVEVGVFALVLPGEVTSFPHVRPAVFAGVLSRAALEAIPLARGVVFRRRGLAEQTAKVEEVLLGRRALFQLGSLPLGDELVRGHPLGPSSRSERSAQGTDSGGSDCIDLNAIPRSFPICWVPPTPRRRAVGSPWLECFP